MIFPSSPFGKIANQDGNMTPEMQLFISQLLQSLNAYFGEKGLLVLPTYTTAELTQLVLAGEVKNGTIMYDSTANAFKGFENGLLKTFTLV